MTKKNLSSLSVETGDRHNGDLWEIADVARYLKRSEPTVRRYIRNLGLPCRRPAGGAPLFDPAEVKAWFLALPENDQAA